ncbi:hypothetical protein ACHAWU_007075 [Discostella pseudostelligera]|uniref:Uncharacterized protein n=1 Tax=Discostella pseudostelligera TaxID=259834 RepID=A0ABD3N181_9STRA
MLSIATSSLRRVAIAAPASTVFARRQLSMTCAQSVHKLQDILEEYRVKNYSQEFPKRFQKDVVKAACTVSSSRSIGGASTPSTLLNTPAVSAEGIEHVLRNIGMGNRMTRSEIESILSEVGACPVGNEFDRRSLSCVISADQMLSLLSTTNWEEEQQRVRA